MRAALQAEKEMFIVAKYLDRSFLPLAEDPAYASYIELQDTGDELVELAASRDLKVLTARIARGALQTHPEHASRALSVAAGRNFPIVAELLLQNGVDVDGLANLETHDTPLHLAARYGHVDCIKVRCGGGNAWLGWAGRGWDGWDAPPHPATACAGLCAGVVRC